MGIIRRGQRPKAGEGIWANFERAAASLGRVGDIFGRVMYGISKDSIRLTRIEDPVTTVTKRYVGVIERESKLHDVVLSVRNSGQNNSHTTMNIEATVHRRPDGISGTGSDVEMLTTKPVINHITGSFASTCESTALASTGITQAVVDPDNNHFSVGDHVLVTVTYTASGGATTDDPEDSSVLLDIRPI